MFILGLLVGPLIGLFLGLRLLGSASLDRRLGLALIGLAVVILASLGFLVQELRIGLAMGMVLGALLAVTPKALTDEVS